MSYCKENNFHVDNTLSSNEGWWFTSSGIKVMNVNSPIIIAPYTNWYNESILTYITKYLQRPALFHFESLW